MKFRTSVLVGLAAVAGALGAGCAVEVRPVTPVGYVYVTHTHVHGPDCGHYRVWNDSMWVYYYDGRWEYYTPGYHRWAYYSPGYEPAALRVHVESAKVYRPRAIPGYVRDSGDAPSATKAPPTVYAEPRPVLVPTKRSDFDDTPRATKAPDGPTKAVRPAEGAGKGGSAPGGGAVRTRPFGATKALPLKHDKK